MALTRTSSRVLLLAFAMAISMLQAAQPADSEGPKHIEFYMYIAVQNNSNLYNPEETFTAVQSGQPLAPQPNSFGVIHTFDNPLMSAPDLNAKHLGRVQGWYGDVGQELLTLLLVQTFTWNDGIYSDTFSLLGVDDTTEEKKYAPIVGGTGDFAYARGVAEQALISTEVVNLEIVSWFHYMVDLRY